MRKAARLVAGLACIVGLSTPVAGQDAAGGTALAERRALDHASRLEDAGRGEEAMRALENLLDDQPQSVSALLMLARVAERSGEPGRVLARTEAALGAGEPGARAVRQLWIRTLQAAGFQDSALAAARRWIEEEPDEQLGYAELAGIWSRVGETSAAVSVLEEGRSAMGSDRLFVQELAALQAELGAYEAAAVEWRAMLAWGDPGVEAVERAMSAEGTDRARATEALRKVLARPGTTFLQQKGGLGLALLLGESQWAGEIAGRMVEELPPAGAAEVLRDYVARARAARDLEGAAWAARELTERSRGEEDRLYWTSVTADLVYEAGDELAARKAFEDLLSRAQPGSDLHGLAVRRLHSLVLRTDPERADRLLREHVERYEEDREVSIRMSVASSRTWADRGDLDRAREIIRVLIPADAAEAALQAGMLGRIELLAGRPGEAAGHLELAATVPGYDPQGRIMALELLSVIEAADSASLSSLGLTLGQCHESGEFEPLLALAESWASGDTRGGDRMADLAAREAEQAGAHEIARHLRRLTVQRWPESAVAPRVLLDLARASARDDVDEASAWLERLIVDYPESAVAPTARSLLAELRNGAPSA